MTTIESICTKWLTHFVATQNIATVPISVATGGMNITWTTPGFIASGEAARAQPSGMRVGGDFSREEHSKLDSFIASAMISRSPAVVDENCGALAKVREEWATGVLCKVPFTDETKKWSRRYGPMLARSIFNGWGVWHPNADCTAFNLLGRTTHNPEDFVRGAYWMVKYYQAHPQEEVNLTNFTILLQGALLEYNRAGKADEAYPVKAMLSSVGLIRQLSSPWSGETTTF